ncbi:MAG: hypothetical protein ACE5KM_11865 [Planctomycetaceae bacterium]
MRSPFQIFRKHQKVLIVVLIGLAMLAFILLDSIRNIGKLSPLTLAFLLAILVGGVCWVVGLQGGKGKQSEFGMGGVIAGLLVGVALMLFNRPTAAVETSAGKLSNEELQAMIVKRRKAVDFMYKAYDAAVKMPEVPPNLRSFPVRFLMRISPPHQQWAENRFRAAFRQPQDSKISERDVLLKYLLLQEAKELDIQVNDDAVQAYLQRSTNNELTTRTYNNILKDLKTGHAEMYDILREEIAVQLVYNLRIPPNLRISTPAEYWDQYRKLHVSQNLEFVGVPTAPFEAQLKQPDDKELRKLFDKYKDRAPTGRPSPDPAFGLPERIQIAYFQADYSAVRKDVEKKLKTEFLTGEEVAAELKQIRDDVADVEKQIQDGTIEKTLAEKRRINARQADLKRLLSSKPVNRFEFEIVKYYEDHKLQDYTNPAWRPPFPKVDDPFLKSDPVPAPKPDGAGGLKTAPQKPAPRPPAPAKPDDSGAGLLPHLLPWGPLSPVAILSQPPGKKSPVKKPGTTKPAPKPPAKPKTLTPTQPPPPPLPEDPSPPFQSLEDVRESIRAKILKRHVVSEIRKRMKQAAAEMEKFADDYLTSLDDASKPFPVNEVDQKLKSAAGRIGLEYRATAPDVSQADFRDEARFPMSKAQQVFGLTGAQFGRRQGDALQRVLFVPRNRDQRGKGKYRVILAEVPNERSNNQLTPSEPSEKVFVLWKTAHLEAKVPAFEDVREDVLKAWKHINARKPAEARAEEIAEIVRKSQKPMRDVVTDMTVTGKPDDRKLPTPQTTFRPVTWMTESRPDVDSSVPSLGIPASGAFGPMRIIGIPKAGDEFRRIVFDELKDGEVGVAPNHDKSMYYVVRVLNRVPTTPAGLKDFMKRLLAEEPASPRTAAYSSLNSAQSRLNAELHQKLRDRLYEKYSVTWNIDPDRR